MKTPFVYITIVLAVLAACKENSQHAATGKTSSVAADTTLKWTDYRIGEPPPVGYYSAFDSVIKKWHIRHERIEGGCEATPEERSVYEKDNPKYFRVLEKQFGKDWLRRFHAEVEVLTRKQENSKQPAS